MSVFLPFFRFICVLRHEMSLLTAPLKEIMQPTATDVTVAWSVCPYVTLVHPAKAVAQNDTPFDRDTRVALC